MALVKRCIAVSAMLIAAGTAVSAAGLTSLGVRPDSLVRGPGNLVQVKNLAGDKGHVRWSMDFSGGGGCEKIFKDYVAASGHSAFSATAASGWSAAICGAAYNKKSKEAAEQAALEACKAGQGKYKVQSVGRCEIFASK